MLYASLPRPHQCTAPAQEFWDLYEGKVLTLPGNADYGMEGKAPHLRRAAERWRKVILRFPSPFPYLESQYVALEGMDGRRSTG